MPGHRVPYFRIPYHWRRFGGVDFGAVNTCFVYLAEVPPHPSLSGDNSVMRTPLWRDEQTNIYTLAPSEPDPHATPKYILYRCVMLGSSSGSGASTTGHTSITGSPDMETAQFVRRAEAFAHMEGIDPSQVKWCGGAPGEKQWRADYNAAGLPVAQPHVSDVEAGIDYVSGAFTNNQLFIMQPPDLSYTADSAGSRSHHANVHDPNDPLAIQAAGLYRVVEELNTYSRKLDDMMEPMDEIKDKNRFHAMDALRYAVLMTALSPAAGMYTEAEIEAKFEHLNRHRPVQTQGAAKTPIAGDPYQQQEGLRELAVNGGYGYPGNRRQRRGVPWGDLTW